MSNEASYVPDNGAKADTAVHGPNGMKCLAWRLPWNPHSFPDFGTHKILKRRVTAKGKRGCWTAQEQLYVFLFIPEI